MHDFLYSGNDDSIYKPGVTPEGRKKIDKVQLLMRRQQLLERGPIPPPTDPEEYEGTLFFCSIYNFLMHITIPAESSPPKNGRSYVDLECEKENEGTPMPPSKKRRVSSTVSTTSTAPALPLRNNLLNSVTNMGPPSSSPTIFHNPDITLTTRIPLTFQPILPSINIDKEPS